jgi:hypothetical protein
VDAQLRAVVDDLQAAEQRLRSLRSTLPCEAWSHRPGVMRWSPAECVEHLNLTSQAVLPLLHAGLTEARCGLRQASTRHHRDPVGWLLWMATAPSCRVRTRTVPALMPRGERPLAVLVTDFAALQTALLACVDAAAGLPIDRVTVTSPVDARLRCNLYAALTLVPRHQHRHLLQAERAARLAVAASSTRPVEARA